MLILISFSPPLFFLTIIFLLHFKSRLKKVSSLRNLLNLPSGHRSLIRTDLGWLLEGAGT